MKSFVITPIFVFTLLWVSFEDRSNLFDQERAVSEVLTDLGIDNSSKKPNFDLEGVSPKAGELLVKEGFAFKANGGKTKEQSDHFVCTSCHNVEKEDSDLAFPNAQDRLEYTAKKGLPFLQGTTLYGAVDRRYYYNGDYEKKYGDLVTPARENIREAIKLCAVECAQGRSLAEWEVESILAYLWTISLKMGDLQFNGEEIELMEKESTSNNERVEIIESKYLDRADAHFTLPPADRKSGYEGLIGDPDNGKLIYDNSCLHCHENQRYSYFHLEDHSLSFKHLNKKAGGYAPHSIYQVTRWGVPSKSGKPSYMPQYTQEKMSDQMLEDLRAYIKSRS